MRVNRNQLAEDIIKYLAHGDFFQLERERKSWLTISINQWANQDQIDWSGTPREFTTRLVFLLPKEIMLDVLKGINDSQGIDTVLDKLIEQLDLIEGPWPPAREDVDLLQQLLATPPEPGAPPYKGLKKYEEEDSDNFFGRGSVTSAVVSDLHTKDFLIVLGASGSGKSSIVRAGVIPVMKGAKALEDGTLPPIGKWKVVTFNPTANPLNKLARSLFPNSDVNQVQFFNLMQNGDDHQVLMQSLSKAIDPAKGEKLLLFVDQFEEIFTLCQDEVERAKFIDILIEASKGPAVTVLITMRADFYGSSLKHEDLKTLLKSSSHPIGPMNSQELLEAIQKPAEKGSWFLQDGLDEEMLDDILNQPGGLPLLSHALLETWERRSGRTLTFSGYQNAGGVKGAIAETAQKTYKNLSEDEKEIAQKIFLSLTELGEGVEDTRRISSRTELIQNIGKGEAKLDPVIQQLSHARLITTDDGEIEVAHEALIRNWPSLQEWLKDNRENIRFERQLQRDAEEWDQNNRENGFLYRGAKLQQASEWLDRQDNRLEGLASAYIIAGLDEVKLAERLEKQRQAELLKAAESRVAAEEEARQQAEKDAIRVQNRNRFAIGLAILGLALATMSFYFFQDSNRNLIDANIKGTEAANNLETATIAQGEAQFAEGTAVAESTRAIAAEATSNAGATEVVQSLIIATAAQGEAETQSQIASAAIEESESSAEEANLQTQLAQAQEVLALSTELLPSGRSPSITETERSILMAAQSIYLNNELGGPLNDVFINNQMRSVLDQLQTNPSWNPIGQQGSDASSVILSNDGMTLASVNFSEIHIRDVNNPMGESKVLSGHDDWVFFIGFLADGDSLISVDRNGIIIKWELGVDKPEPQIFDTGRIANAISMSPDENFLAIGNFQSIQLWDLENLESDPKILEQHSDSIEALAFSGDSNYLASGGGDQKIIIWDLINNNTVPIVLEGHTDRVTSVTFSPDNQLLATGSSDLTIRLWDLNDFSIEPTQLKGFSDWISSINFSPDGKTLASSSFDGKIRLWDVNNPTKEPKILFKSNSGIVSTAYSRDGQKLASGSSDGEILLWNIPSIELEPSILISHDNDGTVYLDNQIYDIAVSPDGMFVASGDGDGNIKLLNLEGPESLPRTLSHHTRRINSISFSTDGQFLAAGSDDNTISLWTLSDLDSGPRILSGHTDIVWSIDFSPNGDKLVSGGWDGLTLLWDLGNIGTQPINLSQHFRPVFSVAFSPDGTKVASGVGDGTIQVWNVNDLDSNPILTVDFEEAIRALAFSSDSQTLASASDNLTIALWDLTNLQKAPITLQGHTDRIMSIDFANDKNFLVSGSEDNTIKLWNLNDLGVEPLTFQHQDAIESVSFFPNDEFVVSGNTDGTVILWPIINQLAELACQNTTRNLTWDEWDQYLSAFPYQKTCSNLPVHCSVLDTEWPEKHLDELNTCRQSES